MKSYGGYSRYFERYGGYFRYLPYPFAGEFWESRQSLSCGVLATLMRWNFTFRSGTLQRIQWWMITRGRWTSSTYHMVQAQTFTESSLVLTGIAAKGIYMKIRLYIRCNRTIGRSSDTWRDWRQSAGVAVIAVKRGTVRVTRQISNFGGLKHHSEVHLTMECLLLWQM